jgi:hypothetical protein
MLSRKSLTSRLTSEPQSLPFESKLVDYRKAPSHFLGALEVLAGARIAVGLTLMIVPLPKT